MRGRVLNTSLRWQASSAILALVGLTIGPMAVAEIEVTPRLQVRQTWTDTANLDDTGDLAGDFITTISPGFQVNGTSGRVQAFIDYTLNGLVFWRNSDESDIRHDLSAAVNTEIIDNRFFIDLRANVDQQFQDFAGQITNVNENFTQNRITVQNYAVTPRWREEISNLAVAELSYTYSITEQENDGDFGSDFGLFADSVGHLGNFRVSSGSKFSRLNWTWNTSYNQIDRDFRDLRFQSFESILDGSYNLNRQIAILGSLGYENIRDETFLVKQTGVVWDVGLRWQPGPRTSIEGRVGRRFNDTVFSGRASYAFTDTDVLTATYSEDLTVGNRVAGGLFATLVDVNNDGTFETPLDGGPIIGADAFLTDAAFRQKRANLTLARQLRKSSVAIQAFWELREFQIADEGQAESFGTSVSGQYRLDGPHTVSAQVLFRHNTFGVSNRDDFVSFSPAYTYTFSRNLNASANYTITQRYSNIPGLERTINSVSATLTAFF